MLGGVEILLGDQHALYMRKSTSQLGTRGDWKDRGEPTLEEGLVDDAPVGLGNDHAGRGEALGRKLTRIAG